MLQNLLRSSGTFSPVPTYNTHTIIHKPHQSLCLRKPVAQLLVGQLNLVKRCTNQEIQAWHRKNGIESKTILARCGGIHHTHSSDADANAVTTRGVTRKRQQLLQQEQNEKKRSSPQQTKRKSTKLSQPVKLYGIEDIDLIDHKMPRRMDYK